MQTGFPKHPKGKPKVTNFKTNIVYALSFMVSGDGGTEAQRLMGLLGLPHVQSMEKDTFQKIESALFPVLDSVKDDCLAEALEKGVQLSMDGNPEFDFDKWKRAVDNGDDLPKHMYAQATVSMDMGWQKKSAGRRYDPLCGHAVLVGMEQSTQANNCPCGENKGKGLHWLIRKHGACRTN